MCSFFPDVSSWVKTCRVCGIFASAHCARCKLANYCSRTHQVYDWENGHKRTCNRKEEYKEKNNNNFLFPEYEIIMDNDDAEEDSEQDDVETEQKEIQKYNMMFRTGKTGTFQNENVNDFLEMFTSANENDEVFMKFRMKIDNDPEQILRYICLFNRSGEIYSNK